MRIDKFLKVSRLIKRRETAKELCDDGDVLINDKVVKPMSEIKEGDIITLILGKKIIKVKVNEVRPFAKKEQASLMTEIIEEGVAKDSEE